MVAKEIFPFPTVTDGFEEANLVGFSHEYDIFDTTFLKFSQKKEVLLKSFLALTFLQPSVMVAKGKISFATMTHSCQAVIIDKFWSQCYQPHFFDTSGNKNIGATTCIG